MKRINIRPSSFRLNLPLQFVRRKIPVLVLLFLKTQRKLAESEKFFQKKKNEINLLRRLGRRLGAVVRFAARFFRMLFRFDRFFFLLLPLAEWIVSSCVVEPSKGSALTAAKFIDETSKFRCFFDCRVLSFLICLRSTGLAVFCLSMAPSICPMTTLFCSRLFTIKGRTDAFCVTVNSVQQRKTLHVEAQRLAERLQELVHLVHQDVRKGL